MSLKFRKLTFGWIPTICRKIDSARIFGVGFGVNKKKGSKLDFAAWLVYLCVCCLRYRRCHTYQYIRCPLIMNTDCEWISW